MRFVYDDGGRATSGRRGAAGDCVCRSVAIASGLPYAKVYDLLADGARGERKSRGRSARNGIHTSRKWFKEQIVALGFVWTPTMGIGTGCRFHLADGELPNGRLVVSLSKHYTAVIDGVIHDTGDPQRATMYYENGVMTRIAERCVYGYWTFAPTER